MSLLDKATPQEWDSLRQPSMQERFDKNQATGKQIGGNHYKKFKIQPAEFCHVNNIPYLEASAIKYLCRWRDKNGFEDLQKAKHFIDLLMEYENAN